MDSNDVDLTGRQLGTCVLEKLVGAGGMGMVYLARQIRPSRNVAVKLLRPPVGQHSDAYHEFLARFRREADVIARLDHINILPIYEYDEQDNMAYLVMPYLDGGSLRTLLAEHGALAPKEALTYIEQAASALQYAHDHNIVHRDIKPANMLFHADGRLVLVDFGIARIIHDGESSPDISLTKTGNFMGSVEYMAPEMVQGKHVDYRADIYELGIVLYQMLTGRVPFQGATAFTIAAMHIHGVPQPLMTLKSSLTPEINAVVQKALAKDPAERYQSVRAFAEAYRGAVSPSSALVDQATDAYAHIPWPHTGKMSEGEATRLVGDGVYPEMVKPDASIHQQYQPVAHSRTTLPSSPEQNNYQQPWSAPSMTPHTHQFAQYTPNTPYQMSEQNMAYETRPATLPPTTSNGKSSRFSVLPWLVVLMALCVIGIVGYVALPSLLDEHGTTPVATPTSIVQPQKSPTQNATATPTATPSDAAIAALQTYFSDINQKDYTDAYNQWDINSNYRKQNSYDKFVSGFTNTLHDDVTVNTVTPQADGSIRLQCSLQTTEQSANGNVTNNYSGYYQIMNDNGSWRIIDARILPA